MKVIQQLKEDLDNCQEWLKFVENYHKEKRRKHSRQRNRENKGVLQLLTNGKPGTLQNRLSSMVNMQRSKSQEKRRSHGLELPEHKLEQMRQKVPKDLREFIFIVFNKGIPSDSMLFNYLTNPTIRANVDEHYQRKYDRLAYLQHFR